MSNDQNENRADEETRSEKTAAAKANAEDRRKNNDQPEKGGEKDDTVLGEINDE